MNVPKGWDGKGRVARGTNERTGGRNDNVE